MLCTFVPYTLSGHIINSYQVFTCLSYFNSIRVRCRFNPTCVTAPQLNMALFLPFGIHAHVEARVAMRRMEEFLRLPESLPSRAKDDSDTRAPSVRVRDLSCAWVDGALVLNGIGFTAEAGQVLCVAGPVGCGKSTLLMALLGELAPVRGAAAIRGATAYASQEPWILSATIRDNILFGAPLDLDWYHRVLFACALNGGRCTCRSHRIMLLQTTLSACRPATTRRLASAA